MRLLLRALPRPSISKIPTIRHHQNQGAAESQLSDVPQDGLRLTLTIVYKPDWTRHKKAAPFRRNDQILEILPIGLIAFPGSGITQNLADNARKMGVPVLRFEEGG
ncbi:hypothetical protein [Niveispirillum sp. KHB5.9]|uniref:hypothetical protein n=1 Tax=Niveispirillum sp. KHB5.9 TaxID=3400269 RepID=UPI003A8C829C